MGSGLPDAIERMRSQSSSRNARPLLAYTMRAHCVGRAPGAAAPAASAPASAAGAAGGGGGGWKRMRTLDAPASFEFCTSSRNTVNSAA